MFFDLAPRLHLIRNEGVQCGIDLDFLSGKKSEKVIGSLWFHDESRRNCLLAIFLFAASVERPLWERAFYHVNQKNRDISVYLVYQYSAIQEEASDTRFYDPISGVLHKNLW
ncbi:MAG TPA: hypothetical protein VMZ49_04320 [Patescibacteria group bacterium]|nr:hypothetical protein [Patescibacteria group bacterium]